MRFLWIFDDFRFQLGTLLGPSWRPRPFQIQEQNCPRPFQIQQPTLEPASRQKRSTDPLGLDFVPFLGRCSQNFEWILMDLFNEFIAYLDLAKVTDTLDPRSSIILSYALCGFANFSSIAIQIGGIGPLVPERKKELAAFGLRSVVGGSLAAFITACLAGLLL